MIDPGEGYRLLTEGETLQKGDEYYHLGRWHNTCGAGHRIGEDGYEIDEGYRRKIEPADGWICIEKQLPDRFPCWVWGRIGGIEPSKGTEKLGGRWYSEDRDAYPITHWKPMQIPEPPKPEVSDEEIAFEAWVSEKPWYAESRTQKLTKQAWLAALQYAKDEADRKP
jgi:hypothetical protein